MNTTVVNCFLIFLHDRKKKRTQGIEMRGLLFSSEILGKNQKMEYANSKKDMIFDFEITEKHKKLRGEQRR